MRVVCREPGSPFVAGRVDGASMRAGRPSARSAVCDAVLGERIAVAVVPRPGATPTIADIAAWLEAKGTAIFKRPERLVILDKLPRNAMNKVVRAELREMLLARLAE